MINKAALLIERLSELHPKGFDLSLERIRRLLEPLSNPQDRIPPAIHIAGTNGKGSASAFSRALLEAAGLGVHVHTSPHLVNWNERFRLAAPGGGKLVDDDVLADALQRVADANLGQKITVFELLTATMFLLFTEHPADAVVLEVGLGGRFDATNIIPDPAVSLIMPISLDHQAFLGDTVEAIAAEKAGIIKSGVPVVIGHQEWPSARDVLIETAERLSCPYQVYGQDFLAYEERGRMVYQDQDGLLDLPLPRLPGRHQLANAAAAIAAVKAAGFSLSLEAVQSAMQTVAWPARLQRLVSGPLVELAPEGSEIWLDGGHNPEAAAVVSEALAGAEERHSRQLVLVTGMINTKDQVGFFRAYVGMARHVYTVPITSSDAGVDPALLAAEAIEAGLTAEPLSSVANALKLLGETWHDETPPRILICGSLYLAGDVLAENDMAPV